MPTTESPVIAHFLAQLAKTLAPLPPAERADIVRELATHFVDGLAEGQTAEVLVARMGSPEEVGQALLTERMLMVDRRRTARELSMVILQAALRPFLITAATFLGLNLASLLYAYGGMPTREGLSLGILLKLTALNVPAVLIVTLPVATFFIGLNGSRRLGEKLSRPFFAKLWRHFAGLTLATGLLTSLIGVGLNDTLVVSANRKLVDWIHVDLQGRSAPPLELRSPQEMSRMQLRQRIARQESALEPILNREALTRQQTQYHLKVALPFMSLAMAGLGLALGRIAARRRWQRLNGLVELGLGGVVVGLSYAAMMLGLGAAPVLRTPLLGAWLPVLMLSGLALGIRGIDAISQSKEAAHA